VNNQAQKLSVRKAQSSLNGFVPNPEEFTKKENSATPTPIAISSRKKKKGGKGQRNDDEGGKKSGKGKQKNKN